MPRRAPGIPRARANVSARLGGRGRGARRCRAERTSFVGQVQAEPGQLQAQSGMVLDRTLGDGSIMPGREEAVVDMPRGHQQRHVAFPLLRQRPKTPVTVEERTPQPPIAGMAGVAGKVGKVSQQRAEIVAVSSPSRSHRSRGRSRPNRGQLARMKSAWMMPHALGCRLRRSKTALVRSATSRKRRRSAGQRISSNSSRGRNGEAAVVNIPAASHRGSVSRPPARKMLGGVVNAGQRLRHMHAGIA